MLPFPKSRPLQFRLGSLFLVTAMVAVCFSVACTAGLMEALGTAAAMAILVAARRCRRGGMFYLDTLLISAPALGLLWLVAVDRSRFLEECDYCRSRSDVTRYRVLGITVSETRHERPTLRSRVAEDLGAPCPHSYQRRHQHRWWGLVYCARPPIRDSSIRDSSIKDSSIRETDQRSADQWYSRPIARIVRSIGRQRPELSEEFRRKVLFDHNLQYWRRFVEELEQAKASHGKPAPGRLSSHVE